eukprot:IDg11203t1
MRTMRASVRSGRGKGATDACCRHSHCCCVDVAIVPQPCLLTICASEYAVKRTGKNSFRNRMAHYDAAVAAHNSRISTSAFAYSFAYNNAIFLLAAPFCASYVFADKVSGELNALCSGAAAAGIALFNSRSALKAIGE